MTNSPRTFDPAALRRFPAGRLDQFAAELAESEAWLTDEARHELYELLDAEFPSRVYSNPPEWSHRVRLDCRRIARWLRQDPARPVVLSARVTPYWVRLAALVAQQVGLSIRPPGGAGR